MAKKAAPKAAEPQAASAPAAKSTAKAAKTSAKAAAAKSTPPAKPATKTEIYSQLADKTNLSKKDVAAVFDGLTELIEKEIGKKGPGQFVLPGLLKIQVVHRPATKARPGFNPATKEPITIKAKPAHKVVKVRPLKALKDFI